MTNSAFVRTLTQSRSPRMNPNIPPSIFDDRKGDAGRADPLRLARSRVEDRDHRGVRHRLGSRRSRLSPTARARRCRAAARLPVRSAASPRGRGAAPARTSSTGGSGRDSGPGGVAEAGLDSRSAFALPRNGGGDTGVPAVGGGDAAPRGLLRTAPGRAAGALGRGRRYDAGAAARRLQATGAALGRCTADRWPQAAAGDAVAGASL